MTKENRLAKRSQITKMDWITEGKKAIERYWMMRRTG
jgi:hypothetical protein